ncbi:MAG: ABC transporter permease subunit [Treponema sp.]|jgi:ABC-type polysaccharide transport system permease subunit|nr:ABC transporter permease subunit [Treponema sp.]
MSIQKPVKYPPPPPVVNFEALKRRKREALLGGRGIWQLYVLILLPVAFVFVFNYMPMGGILIAFKNYSIRRGIFGSEWAGFKYFAEFFSSPIFPAILKNTVVLSLLSLAAGFPFPILLAFSFNEIENFRVKKIVQTITFAPYFVSTVVVVSILFQIFSYRYGVVNAGLKLLGFNAVDFMGLDGFFRPAYVWSGVWQGAGYGSVLYLAALSSVDVTLYDAAAIDGVTRLQRLLHIDLPAITPTIIITLILNTGNILSVGFEKVFLMQNPINYGVSEIISTYVYKVGIAQAQFSFATAVGLFNSVVNCVILFAVNHIAKRVNDTSLF